MYNNYHTMIFIIHINLIMRGYALPFEGGNVRAVNGANP